MFAELDRACRRGQVREESLLLRGLYLVNQGLLNILAPVILRLSVNLVCHSAMFFLRHEVVNLVALESLLVKLNARLIE